MGQAPSGDTYNTDRMGLPLIAGAGDFGESCPEPSKFTTVPTKIGSRGDIILCIRATIGDRNWADREYCLGRGVAGLSGNQKHLDQRYLWHWLGHAAPELKAKGRGATFLQVNKADIGSLLIPLPSLLEQRRIAAILDKADALRAKRRDTIAKLDHLLQFIFLDMFGDPTTNPKEWDVVQVTDVGDVQGGLQLSRARASLSIQAPYLRVANVYRGRLDLSEIKTFGVTPSELERTSLLKNDILIVEGHGNPREIGRCAVWDGSIECCSHQNHLIRLRIDKNKATAAFISHFLNSHSGRQGLIGASNTTSGLNTISVRKVRECRIFLPPFDLQQRFSRITERVEYQKCALQRHSDQLDAFFASLEHSAFNGGT